jgi:hypothetical protein
MAVIESTAQVGGGLYVGRRKLARAFYDFAVDGGAISTINLRGDQLPSGAVILDSMVDVNTIPTSGGAATIAVNTQSAGDIVAATVLGSSPWSTATPKRGAITATSAPVKTTAIRPIQATIAAFVLTAGKFSVLIDYVELAP